MMQNFQFGKLSSARSNRTGTTAQKEKLKKSKKLLTKVKNCDKITLVLVRQHNNRKQNMRL